jgi:hypothetical protein
MLVIIIAFCTILFLLYNVRLGAGSEIPPPAFPVVSKNMLVIILLSYGRFEEEGIPNFGACSNVTSLWLRYCETY